MDHSELIKSEASKLAELHFCPEIKANLARKEASVSSGALYGGLGGAGLGALAGGIHGYVKRKGSLKDALKQSLLGALLGGGVGAGAGAGYGALSGQLQEIGEAAKDRISDAAKGKGPGDAANAGAEAVADTPVLDKVLGQSAIGGIGGATSVGALGYAMDENRARVSDTGAKALHKLRVAKGEDVPGKFKSMVGEAKKNVRANIDAVLDKTTGGKIRLPAPSQPNQQLVRSQVQDQVAKMLDSNVNKDYLVSSNKNIAGPIKGQEIARYLDTGSLPQDKALRNAVREVTGNILTDDMTRIRPAAMRQGNLGIGGRVKDMYRSKGLGKGVLRGGIAGAALPILNQLTQDYYKAK